MTTNFFFRKEKSEDSLQEDTSCAVSDQETEGRERVPWYKILLNDHNKIVVQASHKKHELWLWWIEAFYIYYPAWGFIL